jgi:O-antigen ligase
VSIERKDLFLPTVRSPVFLQNRLYFLIMVAVLCTTVIGWFNPNSWCIIALLACRLFDGNPIDNIKNAFSNRLFVVYFVFVLIDAAGFLHAENEVKQGMIIAKEATLVAIAFVFCAGTFADERTYRQLITVYCLVLLAASLYCLVMAFYHFIQTKDHSFFFYHPLAAPLHQNAVFYSAYVLFGVIFLLSSYGEPAIGPLSAQGKRTLRYALVLFFLGMLILLSSRLLLVLTALILAAIFLRRYSYRRNRRALFIVISCIFLTILLLSVVHNPVRTRFRETADANLTLVRQDSFQSYMHFTSLELRMLQWRFALEILKAKHAWVFGVTPGDSQDLLDQKYTLSNMYIGNPAEGPNRHFRGFLGFNFHNQFLETLVRSGLVGLLALLAIFVTLLARARKYQSWEALFIVLTIAVLFIPEAPLTMQQGVFLFCYFPLLALSRPEGGKTKNAK